MQQGNQLVNYIALKMVKKKKTTSQMPSSKDLMTLKFT